MNGKPTLKDIAGKLKVSTVTVSNALAGRSGVSEELRSRIIREADAMGYRRAKRKEKASSVRKSSLVGMKIGVITEERYLEKFTSFYWELYQKIALEASRNGSFVLLEVLTEETKRAGELPKLVKQKQVDALIVLGKLTAPYLHRLYDCFQEPMLLMDFDDAEIPCDTVLSNGFYGMYEMTNYLIRAGHTKLGFVGSYLETDSIMDRYQGFTKSLLEHGITERREWILEDRDLDTGKISVTLPGEMPTAFVCNCDLIADLMAGELRKAGYRVPEDISLVGYDDYLAEGEMKGRITTYSVDMAAMAHYGLKLLLKRKKGELNEKIVRIVEGRLIERSSVAKYPFCE